MNTTTRRAAAVLASGLLGTAGLLAVAGPAAAAATGAACGNGNGECYISDADGIKAVRIFAGWNNLVASVPGNGATSLTVVYNGGVQATHAQVIDELGNKTMMRVRTIYPQ